MRQRFAVLVVCTANICRSPLAELLLTSRLDPRRFEVASAGVRGWDTHPIDTAVREEALRLGLEPDAFRSRRLQEEHVASADLVLTATREHRADVLDLHPGALRRTFTLREFAAIVPEVDSPDVPDLSALVGAVSRHRSTAPTDIDVPDPYRADEQLHRRVADLIDATTTVVAQHINN